jgi:hypothetical protein
VLTLVSGESLVGRVGEIYVSILLPYCRPRNTRDMSKRTGGCPTLASMGATSVRIRPPAWTLAAVRASLSRVSKPTLGLALLAGKTYENFRA